MSTRRSQSSLALFFFRGLASGLWREMTLYTRFSPIPKYGAALLGISLMSWCHADIAKDRTCIFRSRDFEPRAAVAKNMGRTERWDGSCRASLFVPRSQSKIFWGDCSPIAVNPGADGILAELEDLFLYKGKNNEQVECSVAPSDHIQGR